MRFLYIPTPSFSLCLSPTLHIGHRDGRLALTAGRRVPGRSLTSGLDEHGAGLGARGVAAFLVAAAQTAAPPEALVVVVVVVAVTVAAVVGDDRRGALRPDELAAAGENDDNKQPDEGQGENGRPQQQVQHVAVTQTPLPAMTSTSGQHALISQRVNK